jgi:autotransporter-associated beta strand protein
LGGDPAVRSGSTYAPVQASFNVTTNLSPVDNWTKFSVDPADGVTSSAPSVLRPQVAILETTSAAQSSSIWASAINGSWSRAGNWTGSAPNAVDAGAVINVSTSAALTITLDGPQTVGTLVLGNSDSTTVGYTLHGSGSNTLTFNNSPSNAAITVYNGSQVIDAPVVLADNLVVSGSGTLAFGKSSSITGGYSLTINGAGGTLILSGTDTYSGGTTVNAGTLIVTSNTALPNGSSLTVGAGGAVIFDPSQVTAAPTTVSTASPEVQAVPEPGTLALLIAGLAAGFAIWRRRER